MADNNKWRVIRELLHCDEKRAELSSADARKLCNTFSDFFAGKLTRGAADISAKLTLRRTSDPPPLRQPHGPVMFQLAPVTAGR